MVLGYYQNGLDVKEYSPQRTSIKGSIHRSSNPCFSSWMSHGPRIFNILGTLLLQKLQFHPMVSPGLTLWDSRCVTQRQHSITPTVLLNLISYTQNQYLVCDSYTLPRSTFSLKRNLSPLDYIFCMLILRKYFSEYFTPVTPPFY